jgi:outer membrane receptor for monomeric catechols
LLGNQWALGVRYQITDTDLKTALDLPEAATTTGFDPREELHSLFHQVGLVATFNDRSGLFSQMQANWYSQSNHGYSPEHAGDKFWQIDLFAGYRFSHRRAELRLGLLNLTDTDYHLDPLTSYSEQPRRRTFAARLRFNF